MTMKALANGDAKLIQNAEVMLVQRFDVQRAQGTDAHSNQNAEDPALALAKRLPRSRRTFQSLHIHTESPIIVNEQGTYPAPASEETKPSESCWNHTVIWSTGDHYVSNRALSSL